ncbi:MAG: hypothetical protein ACYC7I_09020 [Gammaproteobacteria bacterium]
MKSHSQPGLFDLETHTAKLTEMGDPLVELNALIDWEAFWLFREKMKELHLERVLFDRFHEQLAKRGFVARAG